MSLFSFLNTTSYSFEGQKEGEEVIVFIHRHWYTILTKVIFLILGMLVPFVILGIFGQVLSSLGLLSVYAVLWAVYYLILWYSLFYSLTMYTLDTWIVTNMRIINSVQHGFFNRSISELSLDKIQDVSINVGGAMATMLNFGDIKVQTAGSERHFVFEDTPHPQEVKDTIMQLVATKRHEIEHEIGKGLKAELFGDVE